MAGGWRVGGWEREEEEVKIFIYIHVSSVQIYTLVINSEQD